MSLSNIFSDEMSAIADRAVFKVPYDPPSLKDSPRNSKTLLECWLNGSRFLLMQKFHHFPSGPSYCLTVESANEANISFNVDWDKCLGR